MKEEIKTLLENNLDTRDKRFMFLKIKFPRLVSRINLEGSISQVSFDILEEFKKQELLENLLIELKRHF